MFWDDRMLELYGLTREGFSGRVESWEGALHPEDRPRARDEVRRALEGSGEFDTEFRVLLPGGAVRHLKADGLVLRDAAGAPVRMLGMNRDVTASRQAEAAQRQSERLFEKMFECSPLLATVGDIDDGTCLAVNRRFLEVSGYSREEVLSRRSVDLGWVTAEDRARIAAQMNARGSIHGMEVAARTKDGRTLWVSFSGEIVELDGRRRLLAVAEDVTERKRAAEAVRAREDELRQSQKLESIGRLAGGVAHDFNNMLGVILGRTEMALRALSGAGTLRSDLEEVRRAALHSADLTRQLLAFARKQAAVPRVLDLNEVTGGILKVLARLLGEQIELSFQPAEDLWRVKVDPSQIDQILANLCVNARDAVAGTGRVSIRTANLPVSAADCEGVPDAVPGQYALLEVRDDGCGMAPETRGRIFEPFFTTKEAGRGTGLGLATVYGIVRQNGGFIRVESAPGQGSTFRVFLPRHRQDLAPDEAAGAAPVPGGRETVLLVEDEPSVLRLAEAMLQPLGYRVLSAPSAEEALRAAADHGGAIDLLVTDVVLPGMNGAELALRLQGERPGMKVLYASGYTADLLPRQDVVLLQKPFTVDDLAAAVRRVLDAPGAQG